jgi:hypothetical protein
MMALLRTQIQFTFKFCAFKAILLGKIHYDEMALTFPQKHIRFSLVE